MKLILVLAFLSTNALAETRWFYCTSEAILKVDYMGIVDSKGKLEGNIAVNIEDSLFDVKREDIKKFWNKKTQKGHEFGFIIDEKATKYWIDLQTLDLKGKFSSDYRGITLKENNVYCEFESLL